MLAMPHLEDIAWNFKEELVKTIRTKVNPGNGTAETTYYQYDGQGQRIRKITENFAAAGNTPGKKEERIYIAGYELYKKHSGPDAGLERRCLSLLDEGHRFVMVETRNGINDGTAPQLVRYQLHNHLGSAALELDNSPTAEVISYEEFHPFGTTAYQARNAAILSAAKRYRYTGMERDEESGLEYHAARYYLPWLGRWLSADPIGIGDGVNVYGYGRNNSIRNTDKKGTQSKSDEIQSPYYPIPPNISSFFIIPKTETKDKAVVNKKIVVDAGHGGDDPGTLKHNGERNEEDITLKVVEYINIRLEELNEIYDQNVDVILTRNEDKNPGGSGQNASLNERVKISKDAKVDFFVSIHIDAAASETADKVSIYRKKNSNDASKNLSANIVKALTGVVTTTQGIVEKEASHHVTREQDTHVGSVLVELGYLTNPAQEKLFNDDLYLQKIGNSMGNAIFNSIYPNPTEKIDPLLSLPIAPSTVVPDKLKVNFTPIVFPSVVSPP
jgi:RHS repeat-associated protein